MKALHDHTGSVRSVAFSSDGAYIVSGSIDTTMGIWDTDTDAELQLLTGHTTWVTSVAFLGDGVHLVSRSRDHCVRMWDAVTSALLNVQEGYIQVQLRPMQTNGWCLPQGISASCMFHGHLESPDCPMQRLKGDSPQR